MPNNDLASIPATVVVAFPAAGAGAPSGGFYEISVSLASLNLSTFANITGAPFQRILHRYEVATYSGGGSPTNAATLLTLATQFATDWYQWQLGPLDQYFVGVVPWTPEGFHDLEWRQEAGKITTHVQRGVFNPTEDLLFCCQSTSEPSPIVATVVQPITSTVTIPTIGNTVNVSVATTTNLYPGQTISVVDPTGPNTITGIVKSVTNDTTLVMLVQQVPVGTVGNVIPVNATLIQGVPPTSYSGITTATFVIPALYNSVTVTTDSTNWMQANQPLLIQDGTNYVYGIANPTSTTQFTFYPTMITAGAAGNTMGNIATIVGSPTPASMPTTATFTIPAVGSSVSVSTSSTALMPSAGQQVAIWDGSNFVFGWGVPSSNTAFTFTTTLVTAGAAGNTMAKAATITPSPIPSTTSATATFVIPSIGTGVTVHTQATSDLSVNQLVTVSDGTNYVTGYVSAIGSATTFTFIPTSIYGGSAGNTMALSAIVNPLSGFVNPILGKPSLATNATLGFPNFPGMAGVPTGVPSFLQTGYVPLVVDTTDGKLYGYYGGAWNSLSGSGGGTTQITAYLSSDASNSTSTPANVTDGTNTLQFAIGASETWTAEFNLLVNGPVNVGTVLSFTGPASPTLVNSINFGYQKFGFIDDNAVGFGTSSAAYSQTATVHAVMMKLTVINGSNAGTVTLQFANASGSSTSLVKAGSYMVARKN